MPHQKLKKRPRNGLVSPSVDVWGVWQRIAETKARTQRSRILRVENEYQKEGGLRVKGGG